MGDNLEQQPPRKRYRPWPFAVASRMEECAANRPRPEGRPEVLSLMIRETKQRRRNLSPTSDSRYDPATTFIRHPPMISAPHQQQIYRLGLQTGASATTSNSIRANETHRRPVGPGPIIFSSHQRETIRRLQSMGRTDDSAIDLASDDNDDDDDDDEIEVVGVKQSTTSRATRTRTDVKPSHTRSAFLAGRSLATSTGCAFLAGRSLTHFNQPSKTSKDPPAFEPTRSKISSKTSRFNSTTASLGKTNRHPIQLVNDKRGREDAPAVKFDVDTEEDYNNMDVEVISISDDDEQEEEDDYEFDDDSEEEYDKKLEEEFRREVQESLKNAGRNDQNFLVTPRSNGGFTVDPKLFMPWSRGFPSACGSLQQPATGTNTSRSHFSNRCGPFFSASSAPNGKGLYRGKITHRRDPSRAKATRAVKPSPHNKKPEVVDLYSSEEEEEDVAPGKVEGNDNISASEDDDDRKPPARKTSSNLDAKLGHLRARSEEEQVGPTGAEAESCTETLNDSLLGSHMPAGEGTREAQADPRSDTQLGATYEELDTEEKSVGCPFKKGGSKPYSRRKFEKLWHHAESLMGKTTVEIEEGKAFKSKASEKNEQYGRILPKGMEKIFKDVMKIERSDVYLDVGHGIGNTCLQAAFTVGCDAKGIECNADRCSVADEFEANLKRIAQVHKRRDGMSFRRGQVEMKCGQLQNRDFREWMVSNTTKIFVNNFLGSFIKGRDSSLHAHLAALFALMDEGTMMVTMAPLSSQMGCLALKAANDKRRKMGLPGSKNASYYEYTKFKIGKQSGLVSWSIGSSCSNKLYAHCYTRVGKPNYLCNNSKCGAAIECIPIDAVQENADGVATIGVCDCRFSDRPLRERKQTTFFGK